MPNLYDRLSCPTRFRYHKCKWPLKLHVADKGVRVGKPRLCLFHQLNCLRTWNEEDSNDLAIICLSIKWILMKEIPDILFCKGRYMPWSCDRQSWDTHLVGILLSRC